MHLHKGEDVGIGDLGDGLARVEERQLHEEAHTCQRGTELLDEFGLRLSGAARGDQVVTISTTSSGSMASAWICSSSLPYSRS